jgi:hypothetical protein
VKRNGKCGIHAAADERKAKTRAKVKADEEESRRNGETALAACGRLAGGGIDAVAEYGARGYTGGVIVAANSLPVLMSLFGGDAA